MGVPLFTTECPQGVYQIAFEITEDAFGQYSLNRNAKKWGYTVYPDLKIEKCDRM